MAERMVGVWCRRGLWSLLLLTLLPTVTVASGALASEAGVRLPEAVELAVAPGRLTEQALVLDPGLPEEAIFTARLAPDGPQQAASSLELSLVDREGQGAPAGLEVSPGESLLLRAAADSEAVTGELRAVLELKAVGVEAPPVLQPVVARISGTTPWSALAVAALAGLVTFLPFVGLGVLLSRSTFISETALAKGLLPLQWTAERELRNALHGREIAEGFVSKHLNPRTRARAWLGWLWTSLRKGELPGIKSRFEETVVLALGRRVEQSSLRIEGQPAREPGVLFARPEGDGVAFFRVSSPEAGEHKPRLVRMHGEKLVEPDPGGSGDEIDGRAAGWQVGGR